MPIWAWVLIIHEELRADLMNCLDELSALAASIAKEFPAPSQNGWPPPA